VHGRQSSVNFQIDNHKLFLFQIFPIKVPTEKLQNEQDQPEGQGDGELNANDLIEVANQSADNVEHENNEADNEIVKQQLVVQYLKVMIHMIVMMKITRVMMLIMMNEDGDDDDIDDDDDDD